MHGGKVKREERGGGKKDKQLEDKMRKKRQKNGEG